MHESVGKGPMSLHIGLHIPARQMPSYAEAEGCDPAVQTRSAGLKLLPRPALCILMSMCVIQDGTGGNLEQCFVT